MQTVTNASTVTSTSEKTAEKAQPRPERFPAHVWRRGFENLAREHAFEPLRIEGTLPPELRGTFYRNGPGQFDVAGERYQHWFDGDGCVVGVRLEAGKAQGAVKLVATKWRENEKKAGKRRYGGYDTPLVSVWREVLRGDNKNPANTSVMIHQDRLYALCEGGKPFEISAEDLATFGERDLDGTVVRTFTAHPHRVPARSAAYGYGLNVARKTTVDCFELPDSGACRRVAQFTVEGARMNHDFAATPKHLVFFFAPFYFSLWKMITGHGLVSGGKYRAERGTEIVIVAIDRPNEIVRFTAPSFYMEHTVNAFERTRADGGTEIVVDYVHYETNAGFEDFVKGLLPGAPKSPLASTLRRAVIDPVKRTFKSEPLLDECVELPRVAPRVEGHPHRYAYAVAFDARVPPQAILKHDLQTDRVTRYAPGPEQYPGEGVFVPRAGAEAEDDGFILTLVLDAKRSASRLDVLDARRIEDGPLARCHFEQALPFGFHGVWQTA